MSVVSNLYAAKVYSEHPVAIWPLDDDASYVSLITDTQRKLEATPPYAGWTVTNGVANDSLVLPNIGSPFNSDIYSGIEGSVPSSNGTVIEAISPNIFQFNKCSEDLETFAVSMYSYQSSNHISKYEIGYRYYDDSTSSYVNVLAEFDPLERPGWTHLQDTFIIQQYDSDYCQLVFRATVDTGGTSGDYDFIFNGISVGQWSEEYTSVSLGSATEPAPVSSGLPLDAVASYQYGILSDNAHYLVESGKLLAKNTGIPMIFGSESITRLYPSLDLSYSVTNKIKTNNIVTLTIGTHTLKVNALIVVSIFDKDFDGKQKITAISSTTISYIKNGSDLSLSSASGTVNQKPPSIIVPNKKMFTEFGRYRDFTLEAWLKIRPLTKKSRKIIGPIDTDDGIYVTEGFITLVIDKVFVSHNVSEWYRPMLVHLVIKDENALMFINGEQVAQVAVDRESLSLSESDWIGFYSYSDFSMFEIDCVSIFPYAVPLQVAKKRFVWGQGTDPIELINDSFDGDEVAVQFSNANYNNNRIYPDMERWDAGYYNNLVATTNSISVPEYTLPEVYLSGRDRVEWYSDNKDLNDLLYPAGNHPLFFSFRPSIESSTWEPVNGTNWTEQCYLNFSTMSFLSSPLSSIYGIFEVEEEVAYSRPLIHIVNGLTGKRFEININGYNVTYSFDGQELTGTGVTVDNSHFVVGMHIPTLSESFSIELSSFFGSPELLSVFIGGNGTTTFEGKIYRIGFSDQLNFGGISEHFNSGTGIANYDDDALLEQHYASYTLSPFFRYSSYFLDISVAAQWEEYFPLSSFASYITKKDGSQFYDIDYMQINYGYPALIEIVPTTVEGEPWTYRDLFNEFNDPIQKSYEILDNPILGRYLTYDDLAHPRAVQYEIETSGSSLDAYVTFQLLAEGADEPLSSFTETKNLTYSYAVYAEDQNTNDDPYKAYKTKFKVVDGTVVYPPKVINFENVAMVVHFDIQQDGIISNPLKVKILEIAAQSLNENTLTPIGTRSGYSVYPYVKTGIYYSGKSKNPIMIGKDNLPYLYLTEKTGLKVLEDNADRELGIQIPINQNKSINYSVGAIQMFIKYDIDIPVIAPQILFTLDHVEGDIEFIITPDTTVQRYYISARDQKTLQEYSNIVFYQNGIKVINPYVGKNEWNSLAFAFEEPLNFSGASGSLDMLFGSRFNNVSFFKPAGLNEISVTIPRLWSDVLYNDQTTSPSNIVDWREWYDENGVIVIPNEWKNIYVLGETIKFSTSPEDIYSAYCGTNIVVSDDNSGMSLQEDYFTMFADQSWLKITQKPA